LLWLCCVGAVQRACLAGAGRLVPALGVLIIAGPAGIGAGGECRAGAREVTRGLLALRSSSGLGVPTSCKRAGEEAAATGGRGCLRFVARWSSARRRARPAPGDSQVVLGRPRLAGRGGYAAIAAVWLMVPAAIRRSQAVRLVVML
jgi:hypothetical protein